jgi:hypothetical protein
MMIKPCDPCTMSTPTSLSSLDSTPPKHTFAVLYGLLNQMSDDTTALRDTMRSYSKRLSNRDLREVLLEPRLHAVPWFRSVGLNSPCDLETFLTFLFTRLAERGDIHLNSRSLTLNAKEAILFGLQAGQHRWLDVLQRLPSVFE